MLQISKFALFHLGLFSGSINSHLAYNHLINIYLKIPGKYPSLTQFIPGIYNKIIIKILGYFWGVIT